MNGIERVIEELGLLLAAKQREVDELSRKLKLVEQYIEVYEEYLKGGDIYGDRNSSRDF